jgi:hypothetical protein
MAMRVVIPGGYMVAAPEANRGLPQMVICTGQGAMAVAVDAEGHLVKTSLKPASKPSHQDKDRPDHPCAFSGSAAAAQTANFALPPEPVRFSQYAARQRPASGPWARRAAALDHRPAFDSLT